jgi:hypothetical protein
VNIIFFMLFSMKNYKKKYFMSFVLFNILFNYKFNESDVYSVNGVVLSVRERERRGGGWRRSWVKHQLLL